MSAEGRQANIDIFGVIGGWRINVNSFADDLKNLGKVSAITVRLNTLGGTFYDGLAIYNLLKQHDAEVTVRVMGYALSMGSLIMLAADKVEMSQNALVMIHRAQGFARGDAKNILKGAEVLKKHEKAVIPDYQQRLGKTESEVLALLDSETWYTANEALDAGLIDAITDPIDLEKFKPEDDNDSGEAPSNKASLLAQLFGAPQPELLAQHFQASHADGDLQDNHIPTMLQSLDKKIQAMQQTMSKQPMAEENNEELDQAKAELKAANEQLATAKSEAQVANEKLAEAEKLVAELSTPDNSTHIPENQGGADDLPKYTY